jgi:hypothetical protein
MLSQIVLCLASASFGAGDVMAAQDLEGGGAPGGQDKVLEALSAYFRARRDVRLRSLIDDMAASRRPVRILDLGGSVAYWKRFGLPYLRERRVRVTVLNQTHDELRADGMGDALFTTAIGDACTLPQFGRLDFDIVHSNSVIEHVGDFARMQAFARETRRVGRAYYVQTPYFWFPIDPHFYRAPMIHWLPRPLGASWLMSYRVAQGGRVRRREHAINILQEVRLLTLRRLRSLFPEARIHHERFGPLTKSLIALHGGRDGAGKK